MIETRGLTRHFGATKAVQDLDLRVEPGEILGLLGPNGAGKTTTVKILTCMIKPTSGSASIAGFDVEEDPLEVKRRIGYVPEAGALYETLTAGEYLNMVANLRGIDGERADRKINELLDLFDVLDARDRRLVGHSKGMRQKVLISAALLGNPEVLFLDEPLSGIDANAALVVKQLLRELAAKGRTILFCSHILEVVERICTRIVIVNGGRKIIEGVPDRIAAEAGAASLEEAFARLTGVRDAGDVTRDLLRALDDSVPAADGPEAAERRA
ncbi:MAG: ABC transporter ATP-binding protein [Gemmatimonadetes bacterium]|nr:ABC transporter ATP-binding protein [Gemmatimonadota bacterium]